MTAAIDFKSLMLSRKPNQFLVLPPDHEARAKPHRTSPIFAATPGDVLDALAAVALAEPRTELLKEDKGARRIELVQRSKTFRFPDFISVEAIEVAPARTALAIYSRAKYGIRDFGVNRARIERWLGALAQRLPKA